jgi:hypothetical protein
MTTNSFMHTPLPQQRGTLEALEQLFPDEVRRTTASRFRSPQDIAMTASLLCQYALMTGRGVPGRFRFRYVNISRPDAEERLPICAATAASFVGSPTPAGVALCLLHIRHGQLLTGHSSGAAVKPWLSSTAAGC